MKKFLAILALLLVSVSAQAEPITVLLTWTANTEPDLFSYKLSQSDSETGTFTVIMPRIPRTITSFEVNNVPDGKTCWKLVAVDMNLNESLPTNAVCVVNDSVAPATPKSFLAVKKPVTPIP